MANAFDVAEYILKTQGEMPAVKLHKLLYYSQAWSLVWDDKPLFANRIEAWRNGPVVREVYAYHRQEYAVSAGKFAAQCSSEGLSKDQRETIDAVLSFYGNKSSQWLSDLTHSESPWQEARRNIPDDVSSRAEISLASMAEYYTGLMAKR